MKLSLIIPVYKVEKYLRKCLDSCINQNVSFEDYEIIVVNDGSPDDCVNILKQYKDTYPELIVISQENKGLSSARNTGLQHATGEYVWFIDSDDWIGSKAIKCIIDLIGKECDNGNIIDIIQIGFQNVYETNQAPTRIEVPVWDGVISGETYMNMSNLPTPVQFNIFRRSLLNDNNLLFAEGLLHEDIEFKPRVLHYCKKCVCINQVLYNYLQRGSGSITSNLKLKNGLDLIKIMSTLDLFSKQNNLTELELSYFRKRISISMNLLLKIYKRLSETERKQILKELLANKHLFKNLRKSNKFLYKIEGILFQTSVNISLRLLSKL